MLRRASCSALIVVVLGAGDAISQSFITDYDFISTDWDSFTLIDFSGTGSHFADQYSLGVPPPSRRVEMFIQAQSSVYAVGQLYDTVWLTPQIDHIHISVDADFEAFNSVNCSGVRYYGLYSDTGGIYITNSHRVVTDTTSEGWKACTFSSLSTDSFFNLTPGPLHPTFAGPAQIGIAISYTGNTSQFEGYSQASTAFDNFVIRIHDEFCECLADPSGCNGVQDITDVVQTINTAFRGTGEVFDPNLNCALATTDVNCSQSTDIIDVIKMINVAFRGADPDAEFCSPQP